MIYFFSRSTVCFIYFMFLNLNYLLITVFLKSLKIQELILVLRLSVVVQCPSHLQLCNPMDCSMPASLSFTISRSLLKHMSIQSVMTSNHLILCHPLLFLPSIFPSIRVFSSDSAFHIRWPKYCSFSFSISPSNEYSGLISFQISLQSKGLSRVFSNTTVQKHQFFDTQLSLRSKSHLHT